MEQAPAERQHPMARCVSLQPLSRLAWAKACDLSFARLRPRDYATALAGF